MSYAACTVRSIAALVGLLFAGLALWTSVAGQRAASGGASWRAGLSAARDGNPAALAEVARLYPGTSAADWAELTTADMAFEEGADLLFTEDVTAAQYGIAPGTVSYGQALATVAQWRKAYQAAGYGHGHRVGLLLDNRPDFLYHWWALNALGVSVVPIHSDMRSAELQYLIDHSEIVLAVVLPNRVADVSQAVQAMGSDCAVWAHGSDAPLPPAARLAPSASQAPGRDSECALLYTSGTTGRPKGCRLLNGYFLAAGQWYADLGGACVTHPAQERVITPLPLNHMNAMAFSTMVVLLTGGCLVQLDRFHPQTWWQSVAQSRATVVHYLGVMPAMLLSATPKASDRAHAVRFGFGAGVDQRNHAPFEERFGFPLVEAWAMTETGAGAVDMMRSIKRALDPKNIMNPGKIFAV
jgi:acyl-CoA synthetase (AMP-forming)/AMP-acid ligase II